MKKYLFVFVLILFPVWESQAAEFHGTVKGYYVDSNSRALLTLQQGNTSNSPSCSGSGVWDFRFDAASESGRHWAGIILAGKMAGKTVKVGYSPSASDFCDVGYVYYLD